MSLRAQASATIEAAFLAGWATSPPFPVQIGNNPFTQPKNATWGRLSIIYGTRTPAGISTMFGRTMGVVYLQVFKPIDGGDRSAVSAADKLDAIFRFHVLPFTVDGTIARVHFEAGAEGPTQAGSRDGYQQQNVMLAFRIDDEAPPV